MELVALISIFLAIIFDPQINRRYVVTAAHCQNKRNQIVEVVLGEHDVAQDPDCPTCLPVQKFDISNRDIIVHEG